MVTFNSEPFIHEAISSVLEQEFDDFELVICDDHSTDATWRIVKQFSDPRIRACRNANNLGEYRNRNKALGFSRGKYLIYIDGDDYLYPNGLVTMVGLMERFPNVAFACARPPSEKFIYPVELTPHQFCSCLFLGPAILGADFTQVMFRTECLRALGGFDGRFRSGDVQSQILLGLQQNCLLINGGLAWWRRRPGQASEALIRDRSHIVETAQISLEIMGRKEFPLSISDTKKARANIARMVGRNMVKCALQGRLALAARLLLRSGIRLTDLHHVLTRYSHPYLSEVSGANPLKLRIASAPSSPNPLLPVAASPRKPYADWRRAGTQLWTVRSRQTAPVSQKARSSTSPA